jgi:hypothetical protein
VTRKVIILIAIGAVLLDAASFAAYHQLFKAAVQSQSPAADAGAAATLIAAGAAFGAMGSAAVALWTLFRTQRTAGAQALFDTYTGWDSRRMRGVRGRAARVLIKLIETETGDILDLPEEATDVLNFLELLAVLVCDSKVLDIDEAWAAYTAYVLPWFKMCKPAIDNYRTLGHDVTVYSSLERLYLGLAAADAAKRTPEERRQRVTVAREQVRTARTREAKAEAKRRLRIAKKTELTVADVVPSAAYIEYFLRWEAKQPDDHGPTQTVTTLDPASHATIRMRL